MTRVSVEIHMLHAWMQNVVLYSGSAADRELIRDHEFHYKVANWSKGKPARRASGQLKFNVLLASYEMVRKDRKVFQDIAWETVIIDEAHRLKNTTSDTRAAVAGMPIQWLLLLTGQCLECLHLLLVMDWSVL